MSKNKLKINLINLKGYFCEKCNIDKWNNQFICLELDHIDGNNKNNELENLRLLCPNCHSQTKNFRGRNIKKIYISDNELIDAIHTTDNIRQALIKVGLTPKAMNYKRAYNLLNISQEKQIQKTNSQYNTNWINNGKINKKIKNSELQEYLLLGWSKGRIIKDIPSIKGKYWVTDGISNKVVSETPPGYWKGKIQK